eukprot:TRINITY_DN14726_c0_g1_i2.p1 TRINITY_DN14726_c0_g1~~TRINITY_DN14726_c0_g1_i2.p1  ORF type:complete len:162 (+),score=26.04 TRINITY_DN14726_c0_g1_i2:42-527(+)
MMRLRESKLGKVEGPAESAKHQDGVRQLRQPQETPSWFGLIPDPGVKVKKEPRVKKETKVLSLRKHVERVRSFLQPRKCVKPRSFVYGIGDSSSSMSDGEDFPVHLRDIKFDVNSVSLESDEEDVAVATPMPRTCCGPTAPPDPRPESAFVRRRLLNRNNV